MSLRRETGTWVTMGCQDVEVQEDLMVVREATLVH